MTPLHSMTSSMWRFESTLVILFLLALTSSNARTISTESGNPDAKRLYDDLLSNYNKLVRPVVNTTDPLTVRIKLKLSQLIDVVSHAYQNPQGNFQMASSKKSLKNSILILSQEEGLYYQAKKTRQLSLLKCIWHSCVLGY